MSDDASFTFTDIFAGIGGMRLALESLHGRCVRTIEWDRFAKTTYNENWPTDPEPDREPVDVHSVITLPDHDVLAAGFPCQPFSIAGVSKKASLGRPHGFLDRTQGTLFFELARLIQAKREEAALGAGRQPPILLLENVKNLLSHGGGNTFRVIREVLDELGYEVTVGVVDARPWRPQHRERVFIVGLLRTAYPGRAYEFSAVPKTGPALDYFDSAEPSLREWVSGAESTGAILERAPSSKYLKSERVWTYLQNYRDKHRAAGNGFGYGLVAPGDVTRTLSARYYKDGSEILVRTSDDRPPRMLTPRECARLMGFPEWFRIPVSDTQAYRQFGNAVVVPVVRHVARGLVDQGYLPSPRQAPYAAFTRLKSRVQAEV